AIGWSGLAETTTPWRVYARPGPCGLPGTGARGGGSARAARSFSRRRVRQRRRLSALRRRRSARAAAPSAPFSAVFGSSGMLALPPPLGLDVDAALACDRQRAGEVGLRVPAPGGVLQLARGV